MKRSNQSCASAKRKRPSAVALSNEAPIPTAWAFTAAIVTGMATIMPACPPRITGPRGSYRWCVKVSALDKAIYQFFPRSEGTQMNDGTDIAVVVIDKAAMRLSFSGAGLPLLLVREGGHEVLSGAKATIGGHMVSGTKQFTVQTHLVQTGDRLCLFTDGYNDQFGGPKGKKFYRRNFIDLVVSLSQPAGAGPLNATESAAALDRRFMDWMGPGEQVDDVLVLVLDV